MTQISDEARKLADGVAKELMNKGLLVEAGWCLFRAMLISPAAPEHQLREMRMAYYTGAQHVFASMMGSLDEGSEPTAADLQRMAHLEAELGKFAEEMLALTRKSHGLSQ